MYFYTYYILFICLHHNILTILAIQSFHLISPPGRVDLVVAKSLCLSVCLCVYFCVCPQNRGCVPESISISISSRALKTGMCSRVDLDLNLNLNLYLNLEQSPKNGDVFQSEPSPHFCVDRVCFFGADRWSPVEP